ncbi:unnamed protein product [Penicillium roqueforti FM164]|uniref:Genomic scaffold, ProqFM164S01 n=1 Tax=Penicillium roqueforti (strain FM164) TaxID=1365484 RepID=W6PUB1_PENRF|nr:unnamed protein product [Penicillium roqueforti FM164]
MFEPSLMSDQGVMFSPNAPLGAYIFSRLCLAEYPAVDLSSLECFPSSLPIWGLWFFAPCRSQAI